MARTAIVLLHRGDPRDVSEARAHLRALYADPGSTSLPFGAAVQDVLAGWIARLDARQLTARLAEVGGRVTFDQRLEEVARELEQRLDGERQGTAGAQWLVRVGYSLRPGGFGALQQQLLSEGVNRVVGVSLYPQRAERRGGAVVRAFVRAFAEDSGLTVSFIDRLAKEPGYLELLRAQLSGGSAALGEELANRATVVCAAPGIEKSDHLAGDDYRAQVEATAAALVASLPFAHKVAYLGERIPGPRLPQVLAALGQAKCPAVLLVPLGTTVDELAVVHGLDVEARQLAKQHGIGRLDRAPQLCGEAGFAALLEQAVKAHLVHVGSLGLR